jgi:hypothetical protein
LTVRNPLPVYPDKQTFSEAVGMSQRGANSGSRGSSLDHLVGAQADPCAQELYALATTVNCDDN